MTLRLEKGFNNLPESAAHLYSAVQQGSKCSIGQRGSVVKTKHTDAYLNAIFAHRKRKWPFHHSQKGWSNLNIDKRDNSDAQRLYRAFTVLITSKVSQCRSSPHQVITFPLALFKVILSPFDSISTSKLTLCLHVSKHSEE